MGGNLQFEFVTELDEFITELEFVSELDGRKVHVMNQPFNVQLHHINGAAMAG